MCVYVCVPACHYERKCQMNSKHDKRYQRYLKWQRAQRNKNNEKKKRTCVYARMCVRVCLHVIMKESADEWQA